MYKDRYIIIYTILWSIYNLQSTFELQGLFSQVLLLSLFFISIYYCYKVNVSNDNNLGVRAVNLLVLLVFIYGMYLIINGEDTRAYGRAYFVVSRYSYLKSFLISLLPVYVYYYHTRNKEIQQTTIVFLFIIFISTYILSFYTTLYTITEGDDEEEITNNIGYYFLSMIPLVYLLKERILFKIAIMGIISFYILMSLKRGAMLTGGVCLLFFLYNSFKNSSKRSKFIVIVLSLVLLYLMYYYVIDFYNSSEYFQHRYEQTIEGETSGRDVIFISIINGFMDQASFSNIIFGNGANATLRLYGNLAHNDWLEFLTNQGLLGISTYLTYWYFIIKTWKKTKGIISLCFGTFILIYFTISFFSMSANDYSPCASLCLGYCLARSNYAKR